MNTHSQGNWTPGKIRGTVVTDDATGFPENTGHSGNDSVDYYGGNLIAESILKEADIQLISAAPEMLEALKQIRTFLLKSGITYDNADIYNTADNAIKKATL